MMISKKLLLNWFMMMKILKGVESTLWMTPLNNDDDDDDTFE